jgi:[NiFe] hydrogenase diaphorase moiety small subunit
MTTSESIITIDKVPVPFRPGQTIFQAALAAGVYIPHLCAHPDFAPHGSCKLCTVLVNGRNASACALKAAPGQEVEVDTPELQAYRRTLVQMLFVEGNHFCPGCEKSGNCQLQALGYEFEMLTPHFVEFFPDRGVDASHPDVLLDFNRCIMCELCVRASRDLDGKSIFALAGRGLHSHLIVNSPSGKLGDTNFSIADKAAHVCPVGTILIKRVGFSQPIGERLYDLAPISAEAGQCAIEEA